MNEALYGLSIIVVDDEEKILHHIVRKIQSVAPLSRIVATAKDGVEALELVRHHRPNIVITDIKMPRMDGLELSKSIRSMFPNVYVVIISGFSDFQFARQAIRYSVFDYLLKPVDTEKLEDVLNRINQEIEVTNNRSSRSFVVSQPKSQDDPQHQVLKGERFGLFFFNFFNLCFDSGDETLEAHYRQELARLDWEKLLDFDDETVHGYAVSDEYMPNQKSVIIAFSSENKVSLPEMAGMIQKRVKSEHSTLPVNIACHSEPVKRGDIWLYSKRLRNAINTAVTPCNPQVIVMEQQELSDGNGEVIDALKQQSENKIREYLTLKSNQEFKKELCKIFQCLIQTAQPQRKVEKVLTYIFGLIEYHLGNYNLERSEMTQLELFRTISLGRKSQEIEEKFLESIDSMLYQDAQNSKQPDMFNNLLDYVDQNYATINSIEDLAETFRYNTTYLSRLFKKISGVTMSKYIMIKRIESAKKLLESDSDISVGMVSEMVGYKDQQYFSRVFRSMVGISPSEYKHR